MIVVSISVCPPFQPLRYTPYNKLYNICCLYLIIPRGFALASPLPLVPRTPPLDAPPLEPDPPRPPEVPPLEEGTGVENFFGVAFEVGGFSTNEVSVVLVLE